MSVTIPSQVANLGKSSGLARALLQANLLSESQLELIQRTSASGKISFVDALIKNGVLSVD